VSAAPPAGTTDEAEGSAGPEDPRADLRWGTVPRLVADAAERHPDAEALVDGGTRRTLSELAADAAELTRALMASGVERGDRVAVWAPNCAEWVVAALGSLGAGAVLVTLNTRFKGGEAAYILRASGARTLFTVQGFLGVDYPALLVGEDLGDLSEIVVLRREGAPSQAAPSQGTTVETTEAGSPGLPVSVTDLTDFLRGTSTVTAEEGAARSASVGPDDISDLIFTSGTTGRPKGAMSTHGQTLRTFGTWASIVGLRPGDRYLIVNPFFHTFGYKAGLLACLMTGATIVPEPVFDVDRVLERIAAERISVLPGPPTLYQSILAHPARASHDLSTLRLGVTGAAVVPVELVVAMRDELGFDTVLTAYGLTESCGTVTMCRRTDPPEVVANTSGRAIPGLEVRVVSPDGTELPRGEAGEIVVRGYTVMSGYWGDPEATADAIDAEGWLHTGDIGVMDGAGNLDITDRLKDMFVVGGFNAYPAEVEAILRGCPGVGPLAVVGVPDERMGEVGCVYLVRPGGIDDTMFARRVLAWARDAMANYKAPRYAVVLDALPMNASGKVLKRDLRQRFARSVESVRGAGGTSGVDGAGSADEIVTYERSK
jgi:acyl-CoA synthetase (AMP-forming)/AMP-acid ligase II